MRKKKMAEENETLRDENESLRAENERLKADAAAVHDDRSSSKEEEKKKIKKFTILGGILGLIVFGLIYVVFPYEVLNWFMPDYQRIITDIFPDAPIIVIDWTNLKPFFERWLYGGVPMAIIGTITWACRKGGRPRLIMSTIQLAASIVWLLYLLNFGNLSNFINISVGGSNYQFGIVLVSLLYLLVLFKALKFLVIYGKYKDARHDYLGE